MKTKRKKKGAFYEYCMNCGADLTKQKGYDNSLPYWICRGCGKMMINPGWEDSNIVWFCDGCEAFLNEQEGFSQDCGIWKCTKCGHENPITAEEIYDSEDEYQSERHNPYRGMPDEDVVRLLGYEELENIPGREDIFLVRDPDTDTLFVKKILSIFDAGIYRFLKEHPVANMPRLYEVCEGENFMVIIEEYIKGNTLAELLLRGGLKEPEAIRIVVSLCGILEALHGLETPIVHRDVKPSNVMIREDGKVYLLDINVAKWIHPGQTEDTRLLGTQYYAAPEQFGYGFSASTDKADIYAVGILLNELLTGHLPKEEKAQEPFWKVIEKCIRLEPSERYTAKELKEKLAEFL